MKIEKKHAMNIAKMFVEFLEGGYYPLDDLEADLYGRIHGFCIHHKLLEESVDEYAGGHAVCKPPAKTKRARLDIQSPAEAYKIMDIHDELAGPRGNYDLSYMKPTLRYLEKHFAQD